MNIETKRLFIRDIQTEDEKPFGEMASDGSLYDVGFDKDCGKWMAEWVAEAKELAVKDNPNVEYLAYAVTLKEDNVSSLQVVEKAGFKLTEKKLYQDLYDEEAIMYHFFSRTIRDAQGTVSE